MAVPEALGGVDGHRGMIRPLKHRADAVFYESSGPVSGNASECVCFF